MAKINKPPSVTDQEAIAYVEYLEKKHKRAIEEVTITIDGGSADLTYKFVPVNFVRIRRITGYLTGDTKSWNNAKASELKDRKSHGLEEL